MPKIDFWRVDWTLAYVPSLFWDFPIIFWFSKVLSVKSFDKLWGNSYTKFIILDIKSILLLYGNTVNCQTFYRGLSKKFTIVFYVFNNDSNFWYSPILSQKTPNLSTIHPTTAVESFLVSIYDLTLTCENFKNLRLKLFRKLFCLYFLLNAWERFWSY